MQAVEDVQAQTLSPDEYARLNFTALEFDELEQWLGRQQVAHATALLKLGIFKLIKKRHLQGDPIPLALNMLAIDTDSRLPRIAEEVVCDNGRREMRRAGCEVTGRFRITNYTRPQLVTVGVDASQRCYVSHISWPVKTHFEYRYTITSIFADGHELVTGTGNPIDRLGSPPWRTWRFEKDEKLTAALQTHSTEAATMLATHGPLKPLEPTLAAQQQFIHDNWQRYITHVLERGVYQRVKL